MDLAGNLLAKDHFRIDIHLPDILDEMTARINQWATAQGASVGRMLGVGLGIPGVINVDAGQIKLSTMLQLRNFPVRDAVTDRIETRVCVDNDVNFAALAEARMGSAVDLKNFVLFHLNASPEANAYTFQSIGSTLYLEGKPYRGTLYSAGEMNRLLQETIPVNNFTAAELLMLDDPDADITDGLEQLAVGMGRALAVICDLIDPQAVIIGSNTPVSNRKLIGMIQTALNRHIAPVPDRLIRVIASGIGDDDVAVGAAIAVLDQAVTDLEDGVLAELNNGTSGGR
jgi:predicted NBD/HSP70 family sugar kinase